MPLLGVATWQARSHPLELVKLDAGRPTESAFSLGADRLRPGAAWEESVFPPDRPKVRNFFEARKVTHLRRSIDYRLIVDDGEPLWVRHWLVSRAPTRTGRWQLHGLLQAIPEQKQLEVECLQISERVRQHIGQELHDDLCQVLTGLTCMMQVVSQRAARQTPAVAAEINGLNRELLRATNRVRAMSHGLFPAQLEQLTLRRALAEFARQTKARYSVAVELDVRGTLAPHMPDQILQLYRIAQEAVGNAVRHGQATAIRIAVIAGAQHVLVRIEDNGTGLPPVLVRPVGIGLRIMQSRARTLGGELRCRNHSERGAVVEFRYPHKLMRGRTPEAAL